MAKGQKITIDKKPTQVDRESTATPVVAILGHVDHGKTTLLDYIRKSHLAAKESGGITQHIGAYQISHKGRKITFIDTPGHEAFSAMRARGGQVSDIALLIIAVDDGLMPQTKESIAHIKAAGVPFIVVVNKTDLPDHNLEKIKKQLSQDGVLVEGYGGDVPVVAVSAKTGQGVDELLEMINLVTDINGIKTENEATFKGIVIESKIDKFRGVVVTLLVKEGTLKIGDTIATPSAQAKIKALVDSEGRQIKEATASTPAEVLGFSTLPKIGEVATGSSAFSSKEETGTSAKKLTHTERLAKIAENEIRLIIKADVAGSLEAITNSVQTLKDQNKQVKVYYAQSGDINDGDVLLAAATRSIVIGFNVGISASAKRLASEEKVLVSQYKLIYELLNELKEGLESVSDKEVEGEIFGQAEIIEIFKIKDEKIAGARVISGRINKNDKVLIKRENKEIGRGKIVSMRHKETDISQAGKGEDLGIIFEKELPFTKGDIIVAIGFSETI